jgi:branched-subunit amino acid transport protein
VIRRLFDHAPPAALAATVGAGIAGGMPLTDLNARAPVAAGAAVAAVVAWRRRGLVLPVLLGIAAAVLVSGLWLASSPG